MNVNDDYKDFWNEYKLVEETKHDVVTEDEDHTKLEVDEVENDTELLRMMGMGHLVEVLNQCRQITDQQLDMSLRQLSTSQADTVRKRVRALNYTIKSRARASVGVGVVASRARGWQRKPDIRNVFKSNVNVEEPETRLVDLGNTGNGNGNDSAGTRSRSRSATPDSLDFDSSQIEQLSERTTCLGADAWTGYSMVGTLVNNRRTHINQDHSSNTNDLLSSVPSFIKIFHQSTDDLEQHPHYTQSVSTHSEYDEIQNEKDTLRRTPSAPPTCNRNHDHNDGRVELKSEDNCDTPSITNHMPLPSLIKSSNEIFGRPNWSHYREAVASNSEGIELLGFNRIGTMYCPRNSRERARIIHTSDREQNRDRRNIVDALIDGPTQRTNLTSKHVSYGVSSAPAAEPATAFHATNIPSNGPMSFEMAFNTNINNNIKKSSSNSSTFLKPLNQLCKNETTYTNINSNCNEYEPEQEIRLPVNRVTDLDFKDMIPILWLEICMLFDKYSLKIHRRKPLKRKRKEDGNLFGVNLSTLVMRDYQFINNDNDSSINDSNSTTVNTYNSSDAVPLIIRDLLSRLSTDNKLKEEGLLRVAGNKQRVEHLCAELEQHYYNKHLYSCNNILNKSTSHELVSILKKILRDLPQPLFTIELVHLFYETHAIQEINDQLNALNLLILLLPVENRTTLYALLEFFIQVVRHQHQNKMNLHNVAMIIAPSLFPPRYIFTTKQNTSKCNDLNSEIAFAATCCKLTETLIEHVQFLQTIPVALLKQAKTANNTNVYNIKNK